MKENNIKAILKAISKGTRAPDYLETGHIPIVDYDLLVSRFVHRQTKESFTETEFDAMEKSNSNTLRIVHIHSDIPIAESEEEVIM